MSAMKYAGIGLTMLLSVTASAQTIYRCGNSFQDRPCEGVGSAIGSYKPDPTPDAELMEADRNLIQAEMLDNQRIRTAMEKRQVTTGMKPYQVRYAWGSPNSINRSGGLYGGTEQWCWHRYGGRTQCVYFSNGKVTSWN